MCVYGSDQDNTSCVEWGLMCTVCARAGVITSIAVSADGRTIVSGSRDKYIAVWSLS